MRRAAAIIAVLMAAMLGAGGARAQGGSNGQIAGPDIRHPIPPPKVPEGARAQAEHVIEHDLGDPSNVRFSDVRAIEVASIKHGPFADPIDGPLSVICGRYAAPDGRGGYNPDAWFFVAIKQGQLLWSASEQAHQMPDEAYLSCKSARLTPDSPPLTGPALE